LAPIGYVLDECDQVQRVTGGRADDRHSEIDPDDRAISAEEPLFDLVFRQLAAANAANEFQARRDIVRIGEILDLLFENLLSRIASDLAITLVDRDPLLLEGQVSNANGGLLERRQEKMTRTTKRHGVFCRPPWHGGGRSKHRRIFERRRTGHGLSITGRRTPLLHKPAVSRRLISHLVR